MHPIVLMCLVSLWLDRPALAGPPVVPIAQHSATPAPQQSATPATQPSATPAPQLSATPAPQQSATPATQPSATPAPQQSATPAPQHSATPAPPPSATPAPQQSATPAPQQGATPAAPGATPAPQALRQDGTGPGGRPRWKGPITLGKALELGLTHSLEVAAGKNRVRAGQAGSDEAEAEGRPKLSLASYVTTGDTPMIFTGAPGVDPNYYARISNPGAVDLNAMLMVPLFTGGVLSHRLDAALEGEKAAIAQEALALRETARAVREAYLMVLLERARQETAGWAVNAQEELLRVAKLQLKTGRAARYVVARAEAEVANARQRANKSQADVTVAQAQLMTVMGAAVDSELSYADRLAPGEDVAAEPGLVTPPAPGDLQENLASALEERPDLVAARHGVAAGEHKIQEARAEFTPQGYLVGMFEASHNYATSVGLDPGYGVGFVVSWPVFDGGLREARVDKARADKEAKEIELHKLEQLVAEQVVSAQARLGAALSNLDLAQAEVAQAREDLRVARLRFELGRSLHLEVLDALATMSRARTNLAEASYEANLAQARLLYALGRL